MQYTDRMLRQQCRLRYYFHEGGELRATVYTCTHPSGNRVDIENKIYKAFREGYGSPSYISFRQEEFIRWQAKDAKIYVRLRKLRSLIISEIFYLNEPLDSFPPLAAAPELPSW